MPAIVIPSGDTTYNLDLGEMIDEVANILRNTNIPIDITRWINLEVLYLSAIYIFREFHASGEITTTSGEPFYQLEDDFYFLKTLVHPTNNIRLAPIDEAILSNFDPKYKTLEGPITHYILNNNSVELYKIPSGTFVLPYSYQRRPLKLVSLADVCDLPSEWHPLITLGAAKRGLRREGRFDEIAEIQADYMQMRKDLVKTVYRRPDSNLVFSGPEVVGARRQWPVLPPNYPRP
jgi:hypothetical protein